MTRWDSMIGALRIGKQLWIVSPCKIIKVTEDDIPYFMRWYNIRTLRNRKYYIKRILHKEK